MPAGPNDDGFIPACTGTLWVLVGWNAGRVGFIPACTGTLNHNQQPLSPRRVHPRVYGDA